MKYLFIIFTLILLLSLSTACAYIEIPSPAANPAPAPAPVPTSPPISPTWTPPPQNQAPVLPSIADAIAIVKPSVVAINTEIASRDLFGRPFTVQGAGSGWIIDAGGIIVTNNHVVQDAGTIDVILDDGKTFTVDTKNVFTDPLNDLAILRIDAQNLPAAKIGDSSGLRVGDWVVAIGNSLGQGIRATEGIVSRKEVTVPVGQGQTLYDLIETSAAINPGNSGGPLVNMSGEVIGITSAKLVEITVEGVGYAISTETALPIIQALIRNGYVTRPWLGVLLQTVDQFTSLRYNLAVSKGVFIAEIVAGSPADKAGLKTADVITGINGKEIATSEELIRSIHSSQIGQSLEITYWRGKTQSTATAVLVESPAPS